MLQPKRTKYRKAQKGTNKGLARRGHMLSFGDYGLQVVENGRLTSRQIEAARIAMSRFIKRGGKIWIRVFPDKPITKKPLEVRMGSGKGAVEGYVAMVKAGRIIYEMEGVNNETASAAFRLAAFKLPLKTRLIKREGQG